MGDGDPLVKGSFAANYVVGQGFPDTSYEINLILKGNPLIELSLMS